MRPEDDELGIAADLPAWAESVTMRLAFFARQDGAAADDELTVVLAALRGRIAEAGDAVRADFMQACLDLIESEAAARPELAVLRDELRSMCAMARAELVGDCDDRPLLARGYALRDLSNIEFFASRVPGRVVWLAAMAARVPQEEGAAAAMLVNDLAVVGRDLPLRALALAAGLRLRR